MKNVGFVKLNSNNLNELMDLSIAAAQEHLIAPNPEWLAQTFIVEESVTYGITYDKQSVGLISLIDPRSSDPDEDKNYTFDCLYVWRVMIDHKFQNKGLGKKAINFALDYARILGLSGVTLTTMDKEPENGLAFYTSQGFIPTGRRIDDEIELIKHIG